MPDPSKYKVRISEDLEEADKIAEISADCFMRAAEVYTKEMVLQEMSRHFSQVWVAESEGRIAGMAITRLIGDEAEIFSFGVSPDERHKGAGIALISKIAEHFLKHDENSGCRRVFLEVAADNQPAIGLYKKAGFSEVSVRKGYYRREEGNVDAVVMALDIGKYA